MLIRYIYETIANWKLQPFFVDDYKLSSERYSQHVCGAAIGPGTVGSVISYTGEAHRVTVFLDVATLLHGRLQSFGANTTAVWSHLHRCWASLRSGNACFSSGVLKLSVHTYADTLYL